MPLLFGKKIPSATYAFKVQILLKSHAMCQLGNEQEQEVCITCCWKVHELAQYGYNLEVKKRVYEKVSNVLEMLMITS